MVVCWSPSQLFLYRKSSKLVLTNLQVGPRPLTHHALGQQDHNPLLLGGQGLHTEACPFASFHPGILSCELSMITTTLHGGVCLCVYVIHPQVCVGLVTKPVTPLQKELISYSVAIHTPNIRRARLLPLNL